MPYGEAVALIGHNGSGKTTFLRIAAGLLEPSDGTVLIDGHPAGSLPARAAMAYLSDSPTFYEDLSVWEHLEYVARLHGHDDWEQDAADLLDHLGLYDRADDLPTSFSRGLRQKASIAMGFIRPFDVLLVDEPFVGLDASGQGSAPGAAGRGPQGRAHLARRHARARRSSTRWLAASPCGTASCSTTGRPRASTCSPSSRSEVEQGAPDGPGRSASDSPPRRLLCRNMFEYSSVSASSYDPGALVAKLNEAAAEGWDVVSIVPTGGDVSAFLRREAGGSAAAEEVVAEVAPAEGWSSGEVVEEVAAEASG